MERRISGPNWATLRRLADAFQVDFLKERMQRRRFHLGDHWFYYTEPA
jgi:hypothetical protein